MLTIKKKLKEKLKNARRIAVLGIGSEFLKDDRAGLVVAGLLEKKIPRNALKRARIFLGGTAPENLTGQIRRFKPTHLVIIDCADFGGEPGAVGVFEPRQDEGISFSTHRLPLGVLASYLEKTVPCRTVFVAIQAKRVAFSPKLSACVRRTAERLAALLADLLG